MTLTRFPDWPQRLVRALDDRRSTPYAWGSNDCATFAAGMIAAVTGQDFAAAFRNRYKSQVGARRMLKAHGWKDLEALADDLLPRQDGRKQRGDVVLYAGRHGAFLGIYWQGLVWGPGPAGLAWWPSDPDAILATWKVG